MNACLDVAGLFNEAFAPMIGEIPLEPLIILRVDVTVQSHSGYAYMGLVPRPPPHAPVTGVGFSPK